MSLRNCLIVFLFSLVSFTVSAQKKNEYKQYRILVLLDGSSSMVEKWVTDATRFQTAGTIITRLMDSVYHFNPDVEFALRVYGHQHGVAEKNCFDTRREVNFSKDNYTQMLLRLEALKPYGVSPIAYSLKQAAESDFNEPHNYAYSLVLITDGGETCNGNICEVVKSLLEKKIEFKPYIISLVDYAPLKEQYACLGNYLLSSNPEQMNKTIGTIAEDYRRVFNIPLLKTQPEPPKPASVTKNEPIITTPIRNTQKEVISALAVRSLSIKPVKVVSWNNLRKRTIQPTPLPEREKEIAIAPVTTPNISAPKKELIAAVKSSRSPSRLVENNIRPATLRRRVIAAIPLPQKEEEPLVVVKKETIAPIRNQAALRNFGLFWSTPSLKPRRIPPTPLPSKETQPTLASAATKPVVRPTTTTRPAAPRPANTVVIKDASFTIKTEPATQTTLEVYFTDGKGKYYQTSPTVLLIDPKTNKEVKRFFRTVDPNGNPDGKEVVPGNYNVLVGKSGNFRAKAVTILPNNKNKVYIVATNGTLKFKYTDNYSRPMSEFTALIKKNFEPGPVMTQPCEQEKQYEAGNYHIELNTLPISRRNLDIDFATDFIVEIDEPGYVNIINTTNMGKASFYFQNGDMFSKFYTIDVTGNPALQKVQLQPGPYEIRYKDNGVFQSTMEKSVKFMVKSNAVTEILLQ